MIRKSDQFTMKMFMNSKVNANANFEVISNLYSKKVIR